MIDVDDLLGIPIIGSVAAIAFDLLLWGGDLFVALLAGILWSLGDLIPILSMLASYVAPQVDWIPQGTLSTLLMIAVLLYIGIGIARMIAD